MTNIDLNSYIASLVGDRIYNVDVFRGALQTIQDKLNGSTDIEGLIPYIDHLNASLDSKYNIYNITSTYVIDTVLSNGIYYFNTNDITTLPEGLDATQNLILISNSTTQILLTSIGIYYRNVIETLVWSTTRTTPVVNSLNSELETSALSAKQGKILNETKFNTNDVTELNLDDITLNGIYNIAANSNISGTVPTISNTSNAVFVSYGTTTGEPFPYYQEVTYTSPQEGYYRYYNNQQFTQWYKKELSNTDQFLVMGYYTTYTKDDLRQSTSDWRLYIKRHPDDSTKLCLRLENMFLQSAQNVIFDFTTDDLNYKLVIDKNNYITYTADTERLGIGTTTTSWSNDSLKTVNYFECLLDINTIADIYLTRYLNISKIILTNSTGSPLSEIQNINYLLDGNNPLELDVSGYYVNYTKDNIRSQDNIHWLLYYKQQTKNKVYLRIQNNFLKSYNNVQRKLKINFSANDILTVTSTGLVYATDVGNTTYNMDLANGFIELSIDTTKIASMYTNSGTNILSISCLDVGDKILTVSGSTYLQLDDITNISNISVYTE